MDLSVLLNVKGISKIFGKTVALKDVSLSFLKGSVHTVLGENGSGKSTLVKLISGIYPPSKGQIFYNNKPYASPINPYITRNMGISTVMQEVLVQPNMSVLDNILLGYDNLFSYKHTKQKRIQIAQDAINLVSKREIDLDAIVGNLALSTQQLIVLARGFASNPKLLILDEATATLDIEDRDKVFEAVNDFTHKGGCVIFVSHRLDEIKYLSHQVSVLHGGVFQKTLTGDEITADAILKLMHSSS